MDKPHVRACTPLEIDCPTNAHSPGEYENWASNNTPFTVRSILLYQTPFNIKYLFFI